MNHRDISKLETLYRSVIINEAQDTLQQRIADVKDLIDKGTILSRNEIMEQFDGIPGADSEQIADELLGDKGPQFDRKNPEGLYLIGLNDGLRKRDFNPRRYSKGRMHSEPEYDLSKEERAEYTAGYTEGEETPWDANYD